MAGPQTAEQPVPTDSTDAGIYTMDSAIDDLIETPRDNEQATKPIDEEPEDQDDLEAEETDEEEEDSETDEQDSEKEQPDSDEDEQPETPEVTLPSDDTVVAVDGETKVTLGELRGEYQKAKTEASELQSTFTKKTQQLSEQVKSVEHQEQQALAHYQMVVSNLGQSLEQLDQSTDWMALKQTDIAEFQQKLNQRNQLENSLNQFSSNAEQLLADSQAARTEREKAQSIAAVSYLTDNVNGWNQDLYKKVAKHAESRGMTQEAFAALRDGPVIEAFHDQMRANEARQTALSKVTNKAPKEAKQKAPKRDTRTGSQKKIAKLQERVNKGDKSAAVELLMSQPRD